jgi:uncharacterized protein YdaU (DUF1376 family)
MDWIKFYHQDFLDACDEDGMSPAEVGAYLRLLLRQFKAGSVPHDDPRRITGIIRCSKEEAAVLWDAVSHKFPDGVNAKMASVREEALERAEARKAKATKAARARWGDAPSNAPSMPEGACSEMPEGACLAMPEEKRREEKREEKTPRARAGARGGEEAPPNIPDRLAPLLREWEAYLAQRGKPLVRASRAKLLAKWSEMTCEAIQSAIDRSVASGYSGLVYAQPGASPAKLQPSRPAWRHPDAPPSTEEAARLDRYHAYLQTEYGNN